MNSGIYKITNAVNGAIYIGSTSDFERRWSEHRRKMRQGVSSCNRIQSAWTKYGESSFSFSILESVDCDSLITREQHWIDKLSPRYNVIPTAGSQAGLRHSEATKKKISEICKARGISSEQREKMLAGLRNMSKENKAIQRKRMSAAHIGNTVMVGRTHSENTKKKMSESQKVRRINEGKCI